MMRKKKTKPAKDLSARAGLVFSVEHFQQTFPQKVDEEAAVFLTGVMEFLVAEILTLAGQEAEMKQSNMIKVHDIPGLQDKRRYAELLELNNRKTSV